MAGVKRAWSKVLAVHRGAKGTTLSPGLSLGTEPVADGRKQLRVLIQTGSGAFTVLTYLVTSALSDSVGPAQGQTAQRFADRGTWTVLEAEARRRTQECRPGTGPGSITAARLAYAITSSQPQVLVAENMDGDWVSTVGVKNTSIAQITAAETVLNEWVAYGREYVFTATVYSQTVTIHAMPMATFLLAGVGRPQ